MVNNTWPDWSNIYVEGLGALSRVYNHEGPPSSWYYDGGLDGGKVHIQKGGAMWLWEYRRVESLTVNRSNGESAGGWLDAGAEWKYYWFIRLKSTYYPGHQTVDSMDMIHRAA